MLRRTFIHLPGIGSARERKLWDQGIHSWSSLNENVDLLFRGPNLRRVRAALERSIEAYSKRDLHHFYDRLPRNELWRLIPGHEGRIAFIDIETTGLALPPRNEVTTISVLMGGQLFQEYETKRKRRLMEKVEEEADILVTYFGEVFDIPFLRKAYRVPLLKAHVDLCFLMRRHGYTGGLKGVERKLKGLPKRVTTEIDGFAAVILWELYKEGNSKALDALLLYNGEDTLILQHLLDRAMAFEANKRPQLDLPGCKFPQVPRLSGRVDRNLLKELRKRLMSTYARAPLW